MQAAGHVAVDVDVFLSFSLFSGKASRVLLPFSKRQLRSK